MLLQFRDFFRNIVAYGFVPFLILLIGLSIWGIYQVVWVRRKYNLLNSLLLATACVTLLGILLLTYGSLFERMSIRTVNHTILSKNIKRSLKLAVIADTHLGIFKNESYLDKVVDKINSIPDLDYLLIPGDWTYHPRVEDMNKLFAPLERVKVPIYGVLGNHDLEQPGEPYRSELMAALKTSGVNLIDNQILKFDDFLLAGVGDRWAGEDDSKFLNTSKDSKPLIVIAHNPDSVRSYPFDMNSNQEILTISGHTHCGQIRIPPIYKLALPVEDGFFDNGWYRTNYNNQLAKPFENISSNPSLINNSLFITCGVGEVGLPIRLFNPPTIDVIEILSQTD